MCVSVCVCESESVCVSESESQCVCLSLSHSSIASVCCAAVRFVIVALLFY